ncbi:MAG: DUF4199 domain-containing protein [Firmicutes bacterium]|nr:DUF4199 domain-containing protein [Bacillota bacterium]
MNATLQGGLILGLSVAAWSYLMGLTGWYRDPAKAALFWMVIPIQIFIVVWTLQRTAPRYGYARQVVQGVALSVIASLLIFGASLLLTTVIFPDYFKDLEALGRLKMAEHGLSPTEIEKVIRESASRQRPLPQAFAGVLGTWVTGLVTSLVTAVFYRRKD